MPRLCTIFTAMKRFFFLLALCIGPVTWAQNDPHFLNGFGYDYSIGVPRNNSGQLFIGNGLSYVPRYVFPVNENFSYGLGAPVGASLVQSLISGQSALGLNFALCGEVHAGMGATSASTKLLGGFFGIGFGSFNVTWFDLYGTTNDAHYGPYVQAGFRIPYYGQDVTIAVAHWQGLNPANGRSQVYAVKLIYELY